MTQKSKTRKASKSAVLAAKPVAKSGKTASRAAIRSDKTSKPRARPAGRQPAMAKAASAKPVTPPVVATPDTQTVVPKAMDVMQQVTFSFFAPQAGAVLVAGDFTQWEVSPISLVRDPAGNWKTTVALRPGQYQYRLLVDGQWQNDPACPDVRPNEFGSANCVLSVAA